MVTSDPTEENFPASHRRAKLFFILGGQFLDRRADARGAEDDQWIVAGNAGKAAGEPDQGERQHRDHGHAQQGGIQCTASARPWWDELHSSYPRGGARMHCNYGPRSLHEAD